MNLGLGLDRGLALTAPRSVSSGGGGGGDVPAWVEALRAPSGDLPTAAGDYVNVRYWAGGQEITAAEWLSDIEYITPGTGLVMDGDDPAPHLIGDARTAGLADALTVLLRFKLEATGQPLVCNNDDDSEESYYLNRLAGPDGQEIGVGGYNGDGGFTEWKVGAAGEGQFPATMDTVVNIAFSRSPTSQAASDGLTLLTASVTNACTPTQVLHGGYSSVDSYGSETTVEFIAFYERQPDADLIAIAGLV